MGLMDGIQLLGFFGQFLYVCFGDLGKGQLGQKLLDGGDWGRGWS